MKKFGIILSLVLLSACAYKSEPIYNVDDPMPPAARALPLERIEALITVAANSLNWKVQRVEVGHLVATETQPEHSAVIDILFDQTHWRTVYRSSTGMNAGAGTIHDHYNFWIRNLEHATNAALASATP